jgi:putative oxidoreductase
MRAHHGLADTGSETLMTHTSERPAHLRQSPVSLASTAHPPLGSSRPGSRYPGGAAVGRLAELNARHAATALRLALAVVFVWFGALKLSGASPVRDLIAATLPFLDPSISVPALGGVELVIGLVLAVGRFPRITLLILAGHLLGTFLTFLTASDLMIRHGNPWELTADGEFVVKNLVLISAALVLIGRYSRQGAESRPTEPTAA